MSKLKLVEFSFKEENKLYEKTALAQMCSSNCTASNTFLPEQKLTARCYQTNKPETSQLQHHTGDCFRLLLRCMVQMRHQNIDMTFI